jgi:lipoprotein NlpD
MSAVGCASIDDLPPPTRRADPVGAQAAVPVAAALPPPATPVAAAAPNIYVVRPHDTLYSIAWRHNLDYRQLAKWNHIGSDFKLAIGQALVLGPAGPAATQRTAPHTSVPQVGRPAPLEEQPKPALATAPAIVDAAPAPSGGSSLLEDEPPLDPPLTPTGTKWVWPTDRASAPQPVPGGGILLLGRLGQDIRAAGRGRVVYTGSGIRGYGNLIIVKHGDNLLSSYAHNQEVLVHEGEEVAMGQVIARMGVGPHRVCALYFEIRVNGKPADPLRYLSAAR